MILEVNPYAILVTVLATLLGVILAAYAKIKRSQAQFVQPVFGTLIQIIFLILLTMMWIMIFSSLLH